MDYEKEYKEALERARQYHKVDKDNTLKLYAKGTMEYLFPVLKESEDKRIKEAISYAIANSTHEDGTLINGVTESEAIAYLEKQGKNNMGISEATKKVLGDNLNKALEKETPESWNEFLDKQGEPKFKVGDWVVDNYGSTWKIEGILLNQFYLLEGVDGISQVRPTIERVDKTYHLWTVQDAKDGDVLVESKELDVILMFRGIGNTEWDNVIDYHCYYDCRREDFIVQKDFKYWGNTENNQLKPATKEQREQLFQKIKEAGYEWDAEKKELKKIEPKFKVGDWVVRGNITAQILDIQEQYYVGIDTNGNDFTSSRFLSDDKIHLWTIQDAKDGDVLCDGIDTVIYKKNIYDMNRRSMFVHCGINNRVGYWYEVGGISPIDYSPATKEQRDLLFKKMHEAGYEWDAEKKELNKIEQKPAWSEEDEEMLEDIRFNYEFNKSGMTEGLIEQYNKWFEKIKSLKPQPQWKPSEEQIQALEYQVNSTYKGSWQYRASKELLEQIKKL